MNVRVWAILEGESNAYVFSNGFTTKQSTDITMAYKLYREAFEELVKEGKPFSIRMDFI